MSGWHPGRPLPCCQGRHLGRAGCRPVPLERDLEATSGLQDKSTKPPLSRGLRGRRRP